VAIKIELVRVHQTTHTIFDTEDVVVDGVYIITRVGCVINKSRGIESTEVERTGWLNLGRVEAEWVQEELVIFTCSYSSRSNRRDISVIYLRYVSIVVCNWE